MTPAGREAALLAVIRSLIAFVSLYNKHAACVVEAKRVMNELGVEVD